MFGEDADYSKVSHWNACSPRNQTDEHDASKVHFQIIQWSLDFHEILRKLFEINLERFGSDSYH